jgi:hypothetical protein
MPRYEKYTVSQIVDAIRASSGLITVAARHLGCAPDTIRNYAKRHPTVRQVLKEEREQVTDIAELALINAIQSGEAWAICFYLKTQGKDRGYVERQEIAHSGHIDVSRLSDEQLQRIVRGEPLAQIAQTAGAS